MIDLCRRHYRLPYGVLLDVVITKELKDLWDIPTLFCIYHAGTLEDTLVICDYVGTDTYHIQCLCKEDCIFSDSKESFAITLILIGLESLYHLCPALV